MAFARFEMDVMPIISASPAELAKGASKIRQDVAMLRSWADTIEALMTKNLQSNGAVVIE